MRLSVGFTAVEMREVVEGYEAQPHGRKTPWLAAQGVSYHQLRRWRSAVFDGDLDRGLVPREGGGMTTSSRRALQRSLARQRAEQAEQQAVLEGEVARLQARVRELEDTNDVLGKAIGLLHEMSEQEPGATTMSDPSDS